MARLENQISNSSEEEEEELSTEGSESESEPGKTLTPPPSSKKSPNSSSDDESETESESDPEKASEMKKKNLVANPNPNPNVKPLASKPMEDEAEVVMEDVELKKPRSKNPTSRYSPPLIKPSAGKRPAAAVDGGDLDSKRIMMKKKTVVAMAAPDAVVVVESNNSNGIGGGGGGEKKQLFQRLWSENDEIELIKGMISYVEEKGKDPVSDVNEFHEFVKKSLQVDVNTRQMTTKVRRLKKKFENNAAKVENKGKVRSFSNPHEKEMYHLSKSLWGIDGNSNGVMSSRVKKVKVTSKTNKIPKNSKGVVVGSGNGDVVLDVTPISVKPKAVHDQGQGQVQGQPSSSNGLVHLDLLMGLGPVTEEMIMIKGLELASEAKRIEFQQKWKELKMMELKHFVEKVDLLKEQAEVVMEAIENSGGAN